MREAYNHMSLDVGSLLWMSFQVLAKIFKHSFLLRKWASFRHSFSIGGQPSDSQLVMDSRDLIYREGKGIKDP